MPAPLSQTTGRRKQAVARVRFRPGQGAITVNKRPFEEYFPSATHRMLATEPLRLTTTTESYDIDATMDGGGMSGQAGAMRLGIARALIELDPELRAALKRAGLLTRDAREKESQEVRPEEGPQGAAVLQAVAAVAQARFGTDGVRGVANAELTAELALALGRAAARVMPAPAFVVGRDTRRSGPCCQAAFSAGLADRGCRRGRPGRAAHARGGLLRRASGPAGGVVSASHNPFEDNGIKLFSAGGHQAARGARGRRRGGDRRHLADCAARPGARPGRRRAGSWPSPSAADDYAAPGGGHRGRRLDGLRSWSTAPTAPPARSPPGSSPRLGADGDHHRRRPDGTNINDGCGSTDPGALAAAVVEQRRRPGAGLRRRRRPGAGRRPHRHRGRRRRPAGPLRPRPGRPRRAGRRHRGGDGHDQPGFRLAMGQRGIAVRETAGGRPPRAGRPRGRGLALGGEQSGHIVFRHRPPPATGSSPAWSWPTWCRRSAGPWPSCRRAGGAGPPGPGQRGGRRPRPLADGRGVARRWPRPRPSSGRAGGWCCARAAPSRWCG